MRQRVLRPCCKYLFFWIKDNLKIKRVLVISSVRLRSLTLLVVKLLVLFVITTITTVRKKMKIFPCFLAIKTLLWRVKRKEKRRLFNWIALNSSLETYENIVQNFFSFNCCSCKYLYFGWWRPPFFVSAVFRFLLWSLIVFSDKKVKVFTAYRGAKPKLEKAEEAGKRR